MPKKPKPKPDDAEQSKRFEETARELGADESGRLFRRALGVIQGHAPVSPPEKSDTLREGKPARKRRKATKP